MNTRGQNDNEVSRELIDFLHYVENTTDEVAEYVESDRIRRIHARVRKVKASEVVGIKYMQSWEEKYYEREEGRIEGAREKMLELVAKKLEKGQSVEEIADALEEDVQTIQQLIDELAKR